MTMEELCRAIAMPEPVTEAVLELHRDPSFNPDVSALTEEARWTDGRQALLAALGEDPDGMKELCCQLRCALKAKAEFDRLGIPEEIYIATMGCFSRFVREHMVSFGRYGFDRGFWTVRQVSVKLLRIGELEYELTTREGVPIISLHIPTDCHFALPLLRESWEQAKALIGRAFPAYADAPGYCSSWLLSPDLAGLLNPESNILAFQRSFSITPVEGQDRSFLQWVYLRSDLAVEDLPENTSLQRNLKQFLLSGNRFRTGRGWLCKEPFL